MLPDGNQGVSLSLSKAFNKRMNLNLLGFDKLNLTVIP